MKLRYYTALCALVLLTIPLVTHAITITIGPDPDKKPAPPKAASYYFLKERDFLEKYVQAKDGGFYFWVDSQGNVTNKRKFSVFQTNIILWVGGLDAQIPDARNRALIISAANELVTELYKGKGEWYEFYDPTTNEKQESSWNPRIDSYISYGLLHAYRLTGDERYRDIAVETNSYQRSGSPNGIIHALYPPFNDIGYRFPEHMGQYQEYSLLRNFDAKNFAAQFDAAYRGRYLEDHAQQGNISYTYYHGAGIIDKLLYGYLSGNEEAYNEGLSLHEKYKILGHSDLKKFEDDNLGEIADNGRDYYDKRLGMALIRWTKEKEGVQRFDATKQWEQILRFWDDKEPYGFLVNGAQDRKTCFSIGQPGLFMDLTAPQVIATHDEAKGLFNHQITVTLRDPVYKWNDHPLRGIGVDPDSLKFTTGFAVKYGNTTLEPGPCDDCYTLHANYVSLVRGKATAVIADYFHNAATLHIDRSGSALLGSMKNLNNLSILYYDVIGSLTGIIISLLVIFRTSGGMRLSTTMIRRIKKIRARLHGEK